MTLQTVATLSMYDWPEIRLATDTYWKALQASLSDRGFSPPATLSRVEDPMLLWQSPNLLLGQTCGLPYTQALQEKTSLIGTPAYDICCGAGSYYSAIIVRDESKFNKLTDLADARFGYNDKLSQSGFAAFYYQMKTDALLPCVLHHQIKTGSHRKSIQAVADGTVDVAAIDAVSWELAKRHEPAAATLRVIKTTNPTPGLPYISARRSARDVDQIHLAVIDAMASLEESIREDLLLMGFAATQDTDYQIIKNRYEIITAAPTITI